MRVLRAVFYFEAVTNLGGAGFALLFPATFLHQFAAEPMPVAAVEFVRWYAVVLVVLAVILLAALRDGTGLVLRPVLIGYLIGDALQIVVSIRFGEAVGAYPVAVHAAIWTSIVYAAARVGYLARSQASLP